MTSIIKLSGTEFTYDEDGSHMNNTTQNTFYMGLKEKKSNVIYFQTTSDKNVIINVKALKALFGIAESENLEYTITEEMPDELEKFSVTDSNKNYGVTVTPISQITGDSGKGQVITATNKVSYIESGKPLYKYEYGVNMNGTITFQVEQKVTEDGVDRYVKATNIRYMAVDEDGNPMTDIKTTDENGYISVDATGKKKFMLLLGVDDSVSINPNDTSSNYRVTEVPSKTAEGCGYLVGFGKSSVFSATSEKTIIQVMDYDTGDAFPTDASGADVFINATGTNEVAVQKKVVDENDTGTFTFKVCEVLGNIELPGEQLSYTVYSVDGDKKVSTGKTGTDGTFQINSGQYAIIDFPKYSTWKVYEKLAGDSGYNLINIEAANFDELSSDNKMNEDSNEDGLCEGDLPKEVAAKEDDGSNKISANGNTVLSANESYGKWKNEQPIKVEYTARYAVILAKNGNDTWSFYWTDKTQAEFAAAVENLSTVYDELALKDDDASKAKKESANGDVKYSINGGALTVAGRTQFTIAQLTALANGVDPATVTENDETTLKIPNTVTVTGEVGYKFLSDASQKVYDSLHRFQTATVSLTNTMVPVVAVADSAFSGKSGIKSLTMGTNLEYIGDSAFKDFKYVTSLDFREANNILKVDSSAFYQVGNGYEGNELEKVYINLPNCKYIAGSAFSGAFEKIGTRTENTEKIISTCGVTIKIGSVNKPVIDIEGYAFNKIMNTSYMTCNLNFELHAETLETNAFSNCFGGVNGDKANTNVMNTTGTVYIDCQYIDYEGFSQCFRSENAQFGDLTVYLHDGTITGEENKKGSLMGSFSNSKWNNVNFIVVNEEGLDKPKFFVVLYHLDNNERLTSGCNNANVVWYANENIQTTSGLGTLNQATGDRNLYHDKGNQNIFNGDKCFKNRKPVLIESEDKLIELLGKDPFNIKRVYKELDKTSTTTNTATTASLQLVTTDCKENGDGLFETTGGVAL